MNEALTVPGSILEWLPLSKAAGFFLATFILEDVAAIGAGLALAAGQIAWPAAFTACFLGIWFGDIGLYVLARTGGRRWFERSRFRKFAAQVDRSERWFRKRGKPILVFSRLIPGARLPTYLAAGFLRVSLPDFLVVTGAASLVWTFIVLWFAQVFGAKLLDWAGAAAFLAGISVLMLIVLLQLARRVNFRSQVNRVARLRHWEFWPAWMFYPPVAIHCLWLAIKYRGLTLPAAANPGMFSGGIVGESKADILKELLATSPEFTAAAELIPAETGSRRHEESQSLCSSMRPPPYVGGYGFAARLERLDKIMAKLQLTFPFVMKPDVGQRGAGVKVIRSRNDAERYLRENKARIVVQRYVPDPCEAGVFYYRFPHEPVGRVFAITEKIFPGVTGDGVRTIAELIQSDTRARYVANTYLKRFDARRNEILPSGEELMLVAAGNHAQGCIFRDGARLLTPELERRIDEISRRLSGFFIGRYDIRFACEDDLRAGRNFQIIELNGAASEATSIYDAKNSLWTAYRVLFQQWNLVFAIGAANRDQGCNPTKLAALWRAWRDYSRIAASYPTAD